MGKIIAFTNQKGGVGKTTSAINVATSLAVSELKTLIIELDPQANATSGLGVNFDKRKNGTYQLLEHTALASETIIKTFKTNGFVLSEPDVLLDSDYIIERSG